jgi:hypothetical protein
MQFQSARKPSESGALVLTEDGFLQVEPSEEFVAELIRLEDEAVRVTRSRGNLLGGLLVGVGLVVLALTWLATRFGGEMRETLTLPTPAEDVDVAADDHGSVRVSLPGFGPQRVQLTWAPGETNADEAARFIAVHRRMRENAERNAK